MIELAGTDYKAPAPFNSETTLGEALLTPTCIYVQACLALVRRGLAHGFSHITGGGLIENIPRVMPTDLAAELDVHALPLPSMMAWLAETGGLTAEEMTRTFNCGVGMVAIVSKENSDSALETLSDAGESPVILGRVIERSGQNQVILDGLGPAWALP